MALNDSGGIRQCLTDLMKADTAGDYSKALQAANKMIRRHPKELLGYKGKLVSLIQLSLYDDALAFIKQCTSAQIGECGFEHGYVLYRLGLNEEALEMLQNVPEDHFEANEIKAQIYYKKEMFQEAHNLYSLLLEQGRNDDYIEERKANFLAVKAQLESVGVEQQVDTVMKTFEHFYNVACHKIEREEWRSCLDSLEKAIELCRTNLLEEGLTDEELEQELGFIKVQRAFILQKLGRTAEARDEYRKIQAIGCKDVSVVATLLNNLSCLDEEATLNNIKKNLKAALALDQTKLTARQKKCLLQNNALMLLRSNQREPCRKILDELHNKYGLTRMSKLIHATLLVKMNDIPKALEVLKSDSSIDVTYAKLHIAINTGLHSEAVDLIKSFPPEVRSSPAIVSLLIASLATLGQTKEAVAEIDQYLKSIKSEADNIELLASAADLEANRGNNQAAAKYLETLRSMKPADNAVKHKLIKVYSQFNQDKAEKLVDELIPAGRNSDINVEELEESDWILRGDKYKQRKEAKMEVDDAEIITRKLKNTRRKRKIRLPKNYNPNIPPDPERWLPKQERAAYKKKHKKNKDRDIGRGTQGSASANPNVEFSSTSPASPRAVPLAQEGPRQQRPAKAQRQKKKKASKF